MSRLETSGYRGWWPMRRITGRDAQGNFKFVECFVNMARTRGRKFETVCPEDGWNGEPPYPTGELTATARHGGGSDELWANLAARKHETLGEVILREPGRTVIRY
ncbi:MAG: hypothetical protein QME75_12480 [Deltaproteobacteria bacterium]|nr:hypothetical protein [Deltaproteobacteria bacterium]